VISLQKRNVTNELCIVQKLHKNVRQFHVAGQDKLISVTFYVVMAVKMPIVGF
jgi:hypothetical protein